MKCFVKVDEQSRIESTTEYQEYASEEMFEFDFPEDFDFGIQDEYRIIDGELIENSKPIPISRQIAELKVKLRETDYVPTKLMDYQVTGTALSDDEAERYADIMAQRQQWREQINELEAQLEGGNSDGSQE